MKKLFVACTLLLTACGGGGGSESPSNVFTNPAQGTVLSTSCQGTTLVEQIADGNGGQNERRTENSADCGYTGPPEQGTVLDEYCDGYTLVQEVADGNGGSNFEDTPYSSVCGAPQEGEALSEPFCIHEDPVDLESWRPFNDHRSYWDSVQRVSDGQGGYTLEKKVHIDENCFIEMEQPDDCPTTYSSTGDSRYDYLTCDGIKQRTPVSFPYTPGTEGDGTIAIIDMLIVFDTKITEEERDGKTVEQFVREQLHFANKMFYRSGVAIGLRLAGIKLVEVAPGDLYRQYYSFPVGRYEFQGLDTWQREVNADMAFLFKQREPNPIACGVANIDGTRGITYTRGIIQCYTNSVFQEAANTRYYERANETFTHEVGHILGLEHDWNLDPDTGENSAGTGLFEYSYGYLLEPGYNPQKDNPDYQGAWGGYGTIMSYADLATGRFSDKSLVCTYPERAEEYAGTSVRMGTEGGCFCSTAIENQPPPTDAHEHLNRVRYVMSQLAENDHNITADGSPFVEAQPVWNNDPHIDNGGLFDLSSQLEWDTEPHFVEMKIMQREFERRQDLCLF